MKPPLARLLAIALSTLIALVLLCFAPGAAGATEAPLFAADIGRSAARALGPAEIAALIAVGFLPALYMIARARAR